MKKSGSIIWGILLILLGIVLGINILGIGEIDIFFKGWWTLFIIVPNLVGLFNDHDKTGDLIGLLIGVALLLACQDIISFRFVWKMILPCILVIVGLSLIFKNFIGRKIYHEIEKLNKNNKDKNEYFATFGNQNINYDNEEFKVANVNAIFGTVLIDVSQAKIKDNAVINSSSVFGEVKVITSDKINVKVKSSNIFGNVEDKRNNKDKKEEGPILYINANCIFGGVKINDKSTKND